MFRDVRPFSYVQEKCWVTLISRGVGLGGVDCQDRSFGLWIRKSEYDAPDREEHAYVCPPPIVRTAHI